MKRNGHLIDRIADLKNLYAAFYKAQKGKATTPAVMAYRQALQANLIRLREHILSGQVPIGDYHYFRIYDPKERQICAAPFEQRVLHHALMNVCHDRFERAQIDHSYASRLDKGTYAAVEQAHRFSRQNGWFLKLDFRKYFDSLDHTVMKHQLRRLFKDPAALALFDRIIDSYETAAGRGVPIGNLTSQYLANHYLSPLDHYIKESLHIRAYVRYMDDLVFWHDAKDALLAAGQAVETYARDRLALMLKPFCLNRCDYGLPFVGYLVFLGQVRLAKRSRNRYARKLRLYHTLLVSGLWTPETFRDHVEPLVAFTEHANARAFRRHVLNGL